MTYEFAEFRVGSNPDLHRRVLGGIASPELNKLLAAHTGASVPTRCGKTREAAAQSPPLLPRGLDPASHIFGGKA